MRFTFDAELFVWNAEKAAWVFAALPEDVADDIDHLAEDPAVKTGGFNSVKVNVEMGRSTWSTSLFPDKGRATFLLPVKKAVRTAEGVGEGDTVTITVELVTDDADIVDPPTP